MSAQKAQEPLSLNGAKLRRRERLGGNFVNTMREYGVQTQNRAGPGNTHDHLAILHPACRELEISVADEIKAAGVFSLREERGLGWQTDRAGDQLQVGQYCAAKRAKPARTAV